MAVVLHLPDTNRSGSVAQITCACGGSVTVSAALAATLVAMLDAEHVCVPVGVDVGA